MLLMTLYQRSTLAETRSIDDPYLTPMHRLTRILAIILQAYRSWSLYVLHEPALEVPRWQKYPTVLLHQFGEVAEQGVLLAEKVKLVVSLFSHHQLVQKHGPIASYELGS